MLALTSPSSGGRLVGIVHLRTKAMKLSGLATLRNTLLEGWGMLLTLKQVNNKDQPAQINKVLLFGNISLPN
jgi:hypothetical protein